MSNREYYRKQRLETEDGNVREVLTRVKTNEQMLPHYRRPDDYPPDIRWRTLEDPRSAFEAWITAPPFEKDTTRYPEDPKISGFPGGYKDLTVQLAWEAWQAAQK